MKELKCFSTCGQIFIFSLLCFITVLPYFRPLYYPYMSMICPYDKYNYLYLFDTYRLAVLIVDFGYFLLYVISLRILSYCGYKIPELYINLALFLFVLCALSLF
jgi:hypothetical protein